MSNTVDKIKAAYADLDAENVFRLEPLYSEDIVFVDPVHTIRGRDLVLSHFSDIYSSVSDCRFQYDETREIITPNSALLSWEMDYRLKRLNRGEPIAVQGSTLIKFEDQIYFHQDWYDLGEMIYEHIPAIGWLIRRIKDRLKMAN